MFKTFKMSAILLQNTYTIDIRLIIIAIRFVIFIGINDFDDIFNFFDRIRSVKSPPIFRQALAHTSDSNYLLQSFNEFRTAIPRSIVAYFTTDQGIKNTRYDGFVRPPSRMKTHAWLLTLFTSKTDNFLNLTLANFKNSLNSGQFAYLNSLNLGFLKSRASEYVFWENFFGVFYFLPSKIW